MPLHRIWQDYSYDEFLNNNGEIKLEPRDYYSTTTLFETIKELVYEADIETGLIGIHQGQGFSPIQILKDALQKNLITQEVDFIKRVVSGNEYQKEVILISRIAMLTKNNIIGYIKDKQVVRI